MSIKEIGTRVYDGGERVQQVTLGVNGNVPKHFPNGTVTELTFGRDQAFALWEDLGLLFDDEGIRGEVWSATLAKRLT